MTGAFPQVMRGVALGFLVIGAMSVMVGCAEEDTGGLSRRRTDKSDDPSTTPNNPNNQTPDPGTVNAAVTACQAVAAPTKISDAKDATDLRVEGSAIFFQSGASVNRILKNGANSKTLVTLPNLTHSWADSKGFLVVEATAVDNPNATLRAFATKGVEEGATPPAFPEYEINEGEGGPGGATAGTDYNAASARVFAADDNNYYLIAEDANNGNSLLVAVNRNDPNNRNTLVTSEKVLTNPQVASSALWYVEDGRIFKMALAVGEQPQGEKKEVFALGTGCNLAVNESTAFCSTGPTIETRDLTGSSAKTFMNVTSSKAPSAPYGQPYYFDNALYLRNQSPDPVIKHLLRSISTSGAEEKLIACNREGAISGIAVDKENVLWSEAGVGVFMTTR